MLATISPTPVSLSGYVTTYSAVASTSGATDLEEVLGFGPGALWFGYALYELAAPVTIGDFEWMDQTAYSGGWHFDASINEYVQRRDELRADFGKQTGWSERASDRKLAYFMEVQRRRLNVRHGAERIVKVRPFGVTLAFPDSPWTGVPQWRLRVPKLFTLVREEVSAGSGSLTGASRREAG